MPTAYGIRERYAPSTYTIDQDPAATLAWLAQRCDRIETAIAILAQGDGNVGAEGEADAGDPDVGTQPIAGAVGVARGVSRSSQNEPYNHNVHGPAAGNPDRKTTEKDGGGPDVEDPLQGAAEVVGGAKRGVAALSGDRFGTRGRQFLASKVGHYNRRLTANTNVMISGINARNRAAYDPRTGQLRTA